MGIAMIRAGRPNMTLAARIRAAAAMSRSHDQREQPAPPDLGTAASPPDGLPRCPFDVAPLMGLLAGSADHQPRNPR